MPVCVLCKVRQKTICKAYFFAARSDENVCKISTRRENENADHKVTSSLFPRWGRWRPWFLACPPLTGEQKRSDYKLNSLYYPVIAEGVGGRGFRMTGAVVFNKSLSTLVILLILRSSLQWNRDSWRTLPTNACEILRTSLNWFFRGRGRGRGPSILQVLFATHRQHARPCTSFLCMVTKATVFLRYTSHSH